MPRIQHLLVLTGLWVLAGAWLPPAGAQTTQGILSGQVYRRDTGAPVEDATVTYFLLAADESGSHVLSADTRTTAEGFYVFAFCSPGTYRLRVTASGYLPSEVYGVNLAVAGRTEVNFPLREKGALWDRDIQEGRVPLPEEATVVHYFAPDVEKLLSATLHLLKPQPETPQATLSWVVDARQLEELPLSARDVYTLLITLPGVTAENATGRGLGLSVNGQRASASNFLLDGAENNDYLTTGPTAILPPEAILEYRISANNFSAEFGRASGFVANAITRSGTNEFHGWAYSYLGHELLNANSFRRNLNGDPRPPLRDLRLGGRLGGPILANRLFFFTAAEKDRHRSLGVEQEYRVPVPALFRACPATASYSLSLLEQFPPPAVPPEGVPEPSPPCLKLTGTVDLNPTISSDTELASARLDYQSSSGAHRLMTRLAISRSNRPDFRFSPYRDFNSALANRTHGLVFNYVRTSGTKFANELRGAWRRGSLLLDRPHQEIPTLISDDDVAYPGSDALYKLHNRDHNGELSDSLTLLRGRHLISAGGGLLVRRPDSLFSLARDGFYSFQDARSFAFGNPDILLVSISRAARPRLVQPSYDRSYSNRQFFGFAQDTYRASARLSVTLGVRYESFGALRNRDTADPRLRLGAGATIDQRLRGADLVLGGEPPRAPYRADRNNWAGRLGIAWRPRAESSATLRAAYGVFYDRPFDNLTQNTRNNSLLLPFFPIRRLDFNYLRSAQEVLAEFTDRPADFPELLWVDEGLRTPYVQSWFAGALQPLGRRLELEVSHLGALGRKLIASDVVNRIYSLAPTPEDPLGRLQPALRNLIFRSNFGSSNYAALGVLARYRSGRALLQTSYTLSRSIDNQSEPLLGDFFNFVYRSEPGSRNLAALTRQFDSRADRGHSDFDQRHNLVVLSTWKLPSPAGLGWWRRFTDNWSVSQLAGFRSGFPFTVFAKAASVSAAAAGSGVLFRNRPDLVPGHTPELSEPRQVPGGVVLLDPTAFRDPAPGQIGNLPRNSFHGPGFWNVDVSVARSVALPWLGEASAVQFRADVFNLFNHANLDAPDGFLDSPTFGHALYGRRGVESVFPGVVPLGESPRQIQLQLRVSF